MCVTRPLKKTNKKQNKTKNKGLGVNWDESPVPFSCHHGVTNSVNVNKHKHVSTGSRWIVVRSRNRLNESWAFREKVVKASGNHSPFAVKIVSWTSRNYVVGQSWLFRGES